MENNAKSNEERKINRIIKRKTILSFIIFFFGLVIIIAGWKWLNNQPQDNKQPIALRKVLNANEKVNATFFSNTNLAREYPKSKAAKNVRVNGDIGLGNDFNSIDWKLTVTKHPNNKPGNMIQFKMEDIKALPKRDVIFNFKCIEGWSQVSHWGGVRFFDFMKKYRLGTHSGKAPNPKHPEDLYKYVGLITPDGEYYVGIDMKSIMHPQTLLCYEMNEKQLPINHGYPLRLIITVKYGIKNLKRIGYIYFSDTRPLDYWYERGYDYDAAL